MRIVSKINLALGAVFAVSVVLNFAILHLTIGPEFQAIEEESAQADFNRVAENIQEHLQTIRTPATDYGAWDDTFAFVSGSMPDYAETNLTPETFVTLGVNVMLFTDRNGRLVWAGAHNLDSKEPMDLPSFAAGDFSSDSPLLKPRDSLQPTSAFISTSSGLMFIGAAPILKSDRTGPAAGVLAVAKFVDVESIKQQTKVEFSIAESAQAEKSPLLAHLYSMLKKEKDARAKFVDDKKIARATLLSDLAGSPLAMLTVQSPRNITATGNKVLDWAVIEMIVVGAMILFVLRTLLNRIAISRLQKLNSHFSNVTSTGALTTLNQTASDDELGALQARFNEMVGQVNELRDRLTDQSFQNGRAEVAASTLHNLRNSLTPITTLFHLMQEDENASWKQNTAKAVTELRDPNLEPDRRAKLRSYMSDIAVRMTEEGLERSERLGQIIEATTEIERMLADQDVTSRSDKLIEPIDTADLIRRASASALRDPGLKIVFDLPRSCPPTLGHRALVLQVMENLFANAGEAIQVAGRRTGKITVRALECDELGHPTLDIRIEDNGDGIAPDRLSRIFQRGETTRQHKKGGFGLHWCAYTVASFGGRLFATSPGIGKGATLHLLLPIHQMTEQKAA